MHDFYADSDAAPPKRSVFFVPGKKTFFSHFPRFPDFADKLDPPCRDTQHAYTSLIWELNK